MGGSIQLLQTLKELEKEEYKERYQIIKRQREIAKSEETPSIEKYRLKLNAMQVGFITNLRKILEKGEDRALLMSSKSIKVVCEEKCLNIIYSPAINFDVIEQNINDGTWIKGTFWVNKTNIVEINQDDESICFTIAKTKGNYYLLDREVFGIKHNISIEKKLNISDKWFITYPKTSVIKKIDELLQDDLCIVADENGEENYLPSRAFLELIEVFPNSYEVKKYVSSRISYLLSTYVEGVWKNKESYERYLEKKEANLPLSSFPNIKLMGYEMYKKAYDELELMLEDSMSYSEKEWQRRIYEIICVLYPKYIARFREIEVGTDGRHMKTPDFMLVDSAGFVDILEIKKPDGIKVVSTTEYRNNYVASRDLEGAIVQIEKYIYILNHEGEARVKKIQDKVRNHLPSNFRLKVVNPQGILLLGRSNNLTDEQLFDFEIIKRQHKNIVDIMTYDDLLKRFRNILNQIKNIR